MKMFKANCVMKIVDMLCAASIIISLVITFYCHKVIIWLEILISLEK